MAAKFIGIDRRLNEMSESLARLRPLTEKAREDFGRAPYLRDIVERNLETAQCCIDIGHRIISLEDARKPADYYEAILILGGVGCGFGAICAADGPNPWIPEYPGA